MPYEESIARAAVAAARKNLLSNWLASVGAKWARREC